MNISDEYRKKMLKLAGTKDLIKKKSLNENEVNDEEHDETMEAQQDEPDWENDCIMQSDGWKTSVTCAGKFLGAFEDDAAAWKTLNRWYAVSNWKPTIWWVSDHGNYWPVDLQGNEIK